MAKFWMAILLFGLIGAAAFGQEPILSFSADPPEVHLSPGGKALFRFNAGNNAAHAADDLTVEVSGVEGLTVDPGKGSIKEIGPFGKGELDFTVAASLDLPPGEYAIKLSILYTYCIDVSCFQVADEFSIPVVVEAGAAAATTTVKRAIPPWVIPGVGGLLLVLGIGIWWSFGFRTPLYLILLLFVVGGFVYGVHLGQHEQAQGIAAVLCTSCVGIEESQNESPTLSKSALAALSKLESDVDLIVFYAPWCHSCPYAEAMVEEMAKVNLHISYKFVNVDTDRDLAAAHGVIRSKRTIVPAILNVGTGEVIFGIEDLETRLLELLGVSA